MSQTNQHNIPEEWLFDPLKEQQMSSIESEIRHILSQQEGTFDPVEELAAYVRAKIRELEKLLEKQDEGMLREEIEAIRKELTNLTTKV